MRGVSRYLSCLAALALLASCGGGKDGDGAGSPAAAEPKELFVYNWSDYIGETTLADFEAATGIKVIYAVMDSNEVLETKLLAGRSGYDVVVPTAPFLERQIKAGVYLKLDKSRLPNLVNMDADILERTALHDPGNEHSITYLWGTVGIGYNVDMVRKALGTETIDSWSAVFEPGSAAKLAKCGIAMLDSPTDIFASVSIYRGLDPNSEKAEDLAAVEETLMKIRPYVKYLHSSSYINDLAAGEICVAVGWNGDVLQARDRGAAAASPVRVAYAIPREGAINYFDLFAIPADAPHPGNAHEFLNFMMDPAVIARVSNKTRFANGNAASLPLIDAQVRDDPAIYPSAEVRARLKPDLAESPEFSRELNRAWTRFRTGQ